MGKLTLYRCDADNCDAEGECESKESKPGWGVFILAFEGGQYDTSEFVLCPDCLTELNEVPQHKKTARFLKNCKKNVRKLTILSPSSLYEL